MDTPGWVCDAEYLRSPVCVSVMVPRLSALCVHVPVPWLSSGDTALTQSRGDAEEDLPWGPAQSLACC